MLKISTTILIIIGLVTSCHSNNPKNPETTAVESSPTLPDNLPKNLDDILKEQLEQINKLKTSDPGRMTIIEEMNKALNQLAQDLTRIGIKVGLKDSALSDISQNLTDKTALKVYQALAARLKELYNKEKRTTVAGKIGEFWLAEIIFYPIAQNFKAIPELKFHLEQPEFFGWGSSFGDKRTKLWAELIYSPAEDTIEVTSNQSRYIQNAADEKSEKPFSLTSSAVFHLATGQVDLKFSYTIDGKKTEWNDNSPFSDSK